MENRTGGDRAYCEKCGATADRGAAYCGLCGGKITLPPSDEEPLADASAHFVPLSRIFALTMLTHGLYMYYWFYLTWTQYKAHTGKPPAFVPWDGDIPILVPMYVMLQFYAHIRRFKELMLRAGTPTSISPAWSLVLAISYFVAVLVGSYFNGSLRSLMNPGTHYDVVRWQVAIAAVLDVMSVFSPLWLMLHVQGDLNRYWEKMSAGPMTTYNINAVEVILCFLGTLNWVGFLFTLSDLA